MKRKRVLWVHTPSIGEYNTVEPLLKKLREEDFFILLTYFSPRATQFLMKQKIPSITIRLNPLPLFGNIKSILKEFNPKGFILVESDRFPNLLTVNVEAKFLINARISRKSYYFLKIFKPIYRPAFNSFQKIICKDEKTKNMFLSLGVNAQKLKVCGNLKIFPKKISSNQNFYFPVKKKVIVLGSSHRGEEELILRIFSRLRNEGKEIFLIIVPRHIERVNEIVKLLSKTSFKFALWSEIKNNPHSLKNLNSLDILVVDTFGELLNFYSIASICLVGGTFVKGIGGHNILEPVYFGKPVIFGKFIDKFKDLESFVIDTLGMGFKVSSENELYNLLQKFLKGEISLTPQADILHIANEIFSCYWQEIFYYLKKL